MPRYTLISKRVRGSVYWFAEERTTGTDGVRRRHQRSLRVKGDRPKDRDEAYRRMMALEREVGAVMSASWVTVSELAREYLAAITGTVRPSTHLLKRRILAPFSAMFSARPAGDIRPADIIAYRTAIARRLKPSTVNTHLSMVRAMFRWAVRSGVVPAHPFTGGEVLRVPRHTFPAFVTPAQFEAAILHEPFEHWRMAYSLAMYAGLRKAEVLNLRWKDVDMRHREIRIESRDDWQTKSGHGRVVPMPGILASRIEAWQSAADASPARLVLQSERGYTFSELTHRWPACIRAAHEADPGIPIITFHGLRHSYASALAMQGVPIPTIQSLLGHAQIQTTMLYAHVQPAIARDQARAAIDALTGEADTEASCV